MIFKATDEFALGATLIVVARCRNGPSIATRVETIQARPTKPMLRPAANAPSTVVPARQSVCSRARVDPREALNHQAMATPWKAANLKDRSVLK